MLEGIELSRNLRSISLAILIFYSTPINKNANHKVDVLYNNWLGKLFLFQTFEELDSIKDKEAEIQQIRQLLDEGQKEEQLC